MNKLNKCLDKKALATIIQAGQSGVDGAEVQEIEAVVSGYIPGLGGAAANTTGIFGYHGAFGYDTDQFLVVPEIGPVINPQCGVAGEHNIGTLVIDPNLPPGSSDVFDLKFTMIDISAGAGSMILFCPDTGEFTAPQGTASSTPGIEKTVTFDASSLPCEIEDVLVGITAWGANGNPIYDGNCDEISDEVGTLVSVTPSQCQPALDCFSQLFGKSLADMVQTSGVLNGYVQTDDQALKDITKIVWSLEGEVPGMQWEMWTDNAAPHGPVGDIFNVSGAGIWGTQGHVNGQSDVQGVHPTLSFNDIQLLGDRDLAILGPQQMLGYGYKKFAQDGFIRDNNQNTGETGRFFCGLPDGCCNNLLQLIADQVTNTGAASRGILGPDPIPVKAGDCLPFVMQISDLSAFFGFDLEFSTDGVTWVNVTDGVIAEKGKWVPRVEACTYLLQENETLLPPVPCCSLPSWDGNETPTGSVGSGNQNEPELGVCGDITIDGYQAAPFTWNLQIRAEFNATPSPKPFQVVICNQSYTAADLDNVQGGDASITITGRADGCIVVAGVIAQNQQFQLTQPNGFSGEDTVAGTAEVLC